jgi:branched-chain amino acid aminotransferase
VSKRSSNLPLEVLNHPAVFETLKLECGKLSAWDMHQARLAASAKALCQDLPWNLQKISEWVMTMIRKEGVKDALLRLMVVFAPKNEAMVLWILPLKSFEKSLYKKGVSIQTAVVRKDSLRATPSSVKSHQYTGAVMAFIEQMTASKKRNFFECLFLNPQGFITEGTVSNIVILRQGALFTPAPSCGILLGVTRQLVGRAALRLGIPFKETTLTRHDLYQAEEAFLTSSLTEIMPVVFCDGRKIGEGKPGPVTARIRQEFKK